MKFDESFDKLRPTTMTLIAKLNGDVNVINATPLLEVYYTDESIYKKSRKRVKINHPGVPGVILSIKYGNCNRGIIQSKRHFRNSIMIVISVTEKNIGMKLSTNTIQICGAKSFKDAQEAADSLVKNINYVKGMLEYIKNNRGSAGLTAEWVKTKTRGEIIEYNDENIHSIIIPKEFPDNIPKIIDPNIACFLIRRAVDFIVHRHYCNQIDWILTLPDLCNIPIKSSHVMSSMVNYNFYIGHSIDRWKLCQEIKNLRIDGITSRYFNLIDSSTRISMKYEIPEHLKDRIRKRDGARNYTFLVHKSGQVTLSGPHPELNKYAYIKILSIINSINDRIRL